MFIANTLLCKDVRNLFSVNDIMLLDRRKLLFANDLMLCRDGLDDLIFVKIGSGGIGH